MKKKLILVLLIVFALSLSLVACEPEPSPEPPQQEPHQHAFSDKWTNDEIYHWHAATCEHVNEVDGKAKHVMQSDADDKTVAKCTVCGYVANTSHKHVYADEYSADENCHWLPTTCGCLVANTALHHFVGGVCDVCGWWSSASDVLLANLSRSDIWNYSVVFDSVKISGVNLLNEASEPAEPMEVTVSGELKLFVTPEGLIQGQGSFDADGLQYKAVVRDSVLYVCGNGQYYRGSVEEILQQNGVDVKPYIDKLDADTKQIREYVEQLQAFASQFPVEDIVAKQLASLFVKVDEGSGDNALTAYAINTDVLRRLNEAVASATVADYANAVLSRLSDTPLGVILGSDVDGLADNVYLLLTNSVQKTLNKLEQNGYSLEELLDQIDALIAEYYPDEQVNDLDGFLLANGVDLDEIVKSVIPFSSVHISVREAIYLVSKFSPEYLWNYYQQNNGGTSISAQQISDDLANLITAYGGKTAYQIIAENSAEIADADYLKSLVNGLIDLSDHCLSVKFYVDADGVLQLIDVTVTPSGNTYEQAEIERLQQLLSNIGGTLQLKRDYTLAEDYSQVVEQVNAYYDSLGALR